MDPNYMLACGIVWRKTADPEAGWELIDGLKSTDLGVRTIAHTLLLENSRESMLLLECALATGELSPDLAGPCIAEIIRAEQVGRRDGLLTRRDLFDAALC